MHGIAKACTHALGVKGLLLDLGYEFEVEIMFDAVAALGIARRRGVGRIRHLDTTDLWIQERLRQARSS